MYCVADLIHDNTRTSVVREFRNPLQLNYDYRHGKPCSRYVACKPSICRRLAMPYLVNFNV